MALTFHQHSNAHPTRSGAIIMYRFIMITVLVIRQLVGMSLQAHELELVGLSSQAHRCLLQLVGLPLRAQELELVGMSSQAHHCPRQLFGMSSRAHELELQVNLVCNS